MNSLKSTMLKCLLIGTFVLALQSFGSAQIYYGNYELSSDTSKIDLQKVSSYIIGADDKLSSTDKVQKLVDWAGKNLDWTYTGNEPRTAKEILKRKGGNLNEQNILVAALIESQGFDTRHIAEVTLQSEKVQRQKSAAKQMKKEGNCVSVSGLNHSDYHWLEFYEPATEEWVPVDASLQVVGVNDWIRARMRFNERNLTGNRIIPVGVYVSDQNCTDIIEDRTEYYMIQSFNKFYGERLTNLKSWDIWKDQLSQLSPYIKDAFEGKHNLHAQQAQIAQLGENYMQMRKEYYNFLLVSNK